MRRGAHGRRGREPTIALINVVFLMLVFFLVAGTLAPAPQGDVRLVQTSGLDGAAPQDVLVVHPDGRLDWRGRAMPSAGAFWAQAGAGAGGVARLLPDRDLPAHRLLELGRDLRAAGAERVVIVAERPAP